MFDQLCAQLERAGVHQAGQEVVDGDAVGPEVGSERTSQRQQRCLRGRVVVVGNDGVLEEVRADVDDAAESDGTHSAEGALGGGECAADRSLELGVELLPGDGVSGATSVTVEGEIGESVVDDRGDGLSEVLLRCGEHRLDLVGLRHVRRHGEAADLCSEPFGGLNTATVVDHDIGTLGGECPCNRGPESPPSAGNQNSLLAQFHTHASRSLAVQRERQCTPWVQTSLRWC